MLKKDFNACASIQAEPKQNSGVQVTEEKYNITTLR